MTVSRRHLIDANTTPYYHIICRCVRRAFLCGQDEFTGRDYSHRRLWIENKIESLSVIFSIDVAAYAIMNNHYHLVLHIDQRKAHNWSLQEVFKRWTSLYSRIPLVQRFLDKVPMSKAELDVVQRIGKEYRQRLMSISWFMRVINEYVARRANKEDNCKGRFWESRFKSQALLDETAVLTCMAYVDLNPVRANIVNTPEASDYTSIQTRLNRNTRATHALKQHLLPFSNSKAHYGVKGLPLSEAVYIELVDWTGRCIRDDKQGEIPSHLAPILDRLNMDEHEWLRHTQFFEARFKRVAGTMESIKRVAHKLRRKWFQVNVRKPKPRPT